MSAHDKYSEALRLLREAQFLAGRMSMGEAWDDAVTALLSCTPSHVGDTAAILRGVIHHWVEFGPEGMDECIHHAAKRLESAPSAIGTSRLADELTAYIAGMSPQAVTEWLYRNWREVVEGLRSSDRTEKPPRGALRDDGSAAPPGE